MGLFDDVLGAPFRLLGIEPSSVPGLNILFDNPAEEKLQKTMKQAGAEYGKQRETSQQQRMQALSQLLPLFQPYNEALRSVYGEQYQIPTQQLLQNPMNLPSAPSGQPSKQEGQKNLPPSMRKKNAQGQ